MNQTIELSETAYQTLLNAAQYAGKTIDAVILENFPQVKPTVSEEERQRANARLRQCMVVYDDPYGSDNEKIDADLARAYADDHAPAL